MSDRAFAGADSLATAYTLAAGVAKLGEFGLVICGKQAIDGDTAQVGPSLAEQLDVPHATYVRKVQSLEDNKIVVERMTEDGYEVIELALPALITVLKDINQPRLPSLKGKMRAKKAEIPVWGKEDLDVDEKLCGLAGSPTQVVKIFTPERTRECRLIEGSAEEQAKVLASELKRSSRREGQLVVGGIKVDLDLCTGCSVCADHCPFGAIEVKDDKAVITDICTICGACIDSCSFGPQPGGRGSSFSSARFIRRLGLCRTNWRGDCSCCLRAFRGSPQACREHGSEVGAVLFGSSMQDAANDLIAYGADRVYLLDDAIFADYHDELYAAALADLIQDEKPEILLLGATTIGRSLAPRVAARVGTGLTADCTGLAVNPETGLLEQTRPAFGGNIMATIICPRHRPQMATVRPKVFQAAPKDPARKGEIVNLKSPEVALRSRLLERVREQAENVNLDEADIIVAGGRGLADEKGFKLLSELAEA